MTYSAITHAELIALLHRIEQLLDDLRALPPWTWENDDCFTLAVGLAEILDIESPTEEEDDEDEEHSAPPH